MKDYRSEKIKHIKTYVPGEQPKDKKYIKLNTNENPYPPSPSVRAAIISELDRNRLALYPDPDTSVLINALAGKFSISAGQIFTGNGSDEILAFCFPAFFEGKNPVIFADITYSFYPVYCDFFSVAYRQIPLDSNWDIPVSEFCTGEAGGILIANPNAPTGKLVSITDIENIVKSNPDSVVVVDEAYIAFGGVSAAGLIHKYPNLLVVQTFSKSYALAGMRVGYALGSEPLIAALYTVKNSFNSYTINTLSILSAAAAVNDTEYHETMTNRIINTRERVSARLKELGFLVLPSKANFIFVSHHTLKAVDLAAKLRIRGVLVRHFNTGRISNFMRITIGTDEQMDTLCELLEEIL